MKRFSISAVATCVFAGVALAGPAAADPADPTDPANLADPTGPTAEVIASQQGITGEIAALESEFNHLSARDRMARHGQEKINYLNGFIEQENALLGKIKELSARAEKPEDKQRLDRLSTLVEALLADDIKGLDAAKRSQLSSFPGQDLLNKLSTLFAPLDQVRERVNLSS